MSGTDMIKWVEYKGTIVVTEMDFSNYFSCPVWPLLIQEDYHITKETLPFTEEVIWPGEDRKVSQRLYVGQVIEAEHWKEVQRALREAYLVMEVAREGATGGSLNLGR
jgi:hypothetical protein